MYLYNGQPKGNQEAQFAILDVSVGREDLQQCADAVMRLRAEYLYSRAEFGAITFYTERGLRLNFGQRAAEHGRAAFDKYLREVFMYCSTIQYDRAGGRDDPGGFAGSRHVGRRCGGG